MIHALHFMRNCIIESFQHKLNCCFGRYITSYWIACCEWDEHLTTLNHFKRVFLTHIAPVWAKLHTFKNSAFILPLSHIKISVYAELGARVYEAFYDILTICQKSTPGYFFKIWILHKKHGLQGCAKFYSCKYFLKTSKLLNIHIFSCLK